MRSLLGHGELMVVETDDDWFLGTVELGAGELVIRSGFVGRPVVLLPEDVVRIVLASDFDLDEE